MIIGFILMALISFLAAGAAINSAAKMLHNWFSSLVYDSDWTDVLGQFLLVIMATFFLIVGFLHTMAIIVVGVN